MPTNLKAELLEKSNNGLDLFKLYFGGELQGKSKNRFKNVRNPFYDDKNASLSVYLGDNGRWLFKDHGNVNYSGDIFDFYAHHYKLDVTQDFSKLLVLMEGILTQGKYNIFEREVFKVAVETDEKNSISVKLNEIEFTPQALQFWAQFNITEEVLHVNNVRQVQGYHISFSENDYKHVSLGYDLTFAYKSGDFYKLYVPEPKKFWSVGRKTSEYIFGNNFSTNSNTKFLVGGEKDVMTLHALGYEAFCLGSETSKPSRRLAKEVFEEGIEIVVLYDNDDAGRKGAEKISNLYSWRVADLSTILEEKIEIKDISDYVKQGFSIDKLKCFLDGFGIGGLEDEIINQQREQVGEVGEIEYFSDEVDVPNYTYIDESVYDRLPQLFKSITTPITNKIQKDLILIASLGVLSNLIEVSGVYRNKVVYPNLFIFITAPAASGKGAMSWVRRLGNAVQQEYNRQYNNDKAEYEDNKRKGEKPKRKTVFQSANSSVSAFIKQLWKNNGKSTIFETEADSLNGVMKNDDWGSFSDVLRRAFEFEDISMLRVDEDDSVEIENPRLSVVLSGTKDQLFKLIPSAENGLFSRFIFMEFPRQREWDDDVESDESFDAFYNKMSEKVHQYYRKCKEEEIRFRLTLVQKYKRKQHYTQLQDEYETLYGEDIIASIRRVANIHLRIAMLLSTIRMLDNEKMYSELFCDDVDFDLAQDLVGWFLNHTTTIFGQLPNRPKEYNELKTNVKKLYDALQMKFTFQDALSVGDKLKIPNGTVQKYLAKLKKAGLILAEAHGKYSKTKGTN